jgi:hypothetical protein
MTEDGMSVCKVHYTADSEKATPEWKANALIGYPGGEKGIRWRKEMEIDFSVFAGKVVYPTFSRKRHVAAEPLLPYVLEGIAKRNKQVVNGWDNTGLSPACLTTYINSIGQWMIFKEFCGDDIGIEDFGDSVKMWWGLHLPPNTEFIHIGDPAGKTRDSRKKSPAQYLAEHCGIRIYDGIQTFKIRRECIEGRLNKTVAGGEPAILIDPSCAMLITGFEGGYSYPEIGNTGFYHPEPSKNQYSHIHDAAQYPATIIWGPKDQSQLNEEDEDEGRGYQGRSEIGGY